MKEQNTTHQDEIVPLKKNINGIQQNTTDLRMFKRFIKSNIKKAAGEG